MKPGSGWPIAIAAILGITVIGNFAVMRIASNDPSFAVEPDYYSKAVAYDSTMAQQRKNLSLGWGVEAMLDTMVSGEMTKLTVHLRAPDASPLSGASVSVMARFNARANDTLTAQLSETEPGFYVASLPIHTPGEWEVRVDAIMAGSNSPEIADHYSVSKRITAIGLENHTGTSKKAGVSGAGGVSR